MRKKPHPPRRARHKGDWIGTRQGTSYADWARDHEARLKWWLSLPAVTQSMLRHTFNGTTGAKVMRAAGLMPDAMELHGLFLMAHGKL